MTSRLNRNRFTVVAFLSCSLLAGASWAESTAFSVNPALSSLTLSGTFNGFPFGAQFGLLIDNGMSAVPLSLITSYAGTITADVNASANSIQVTGGNIVAQNNTSSFSHPPFSSGTFADYGIYQSNGAQLLSQQTSYYAAIRGFSFSLAGADVFSPPIFDASGLSGVINSGELDSQYTSETISSPAVSTQIAGVFSLAAGNASLVDSGGEEILTIPIDTNIIIDVSGLGIPGGPVPLDLQLSGDIVATSPLPSAFLGGGLLMAILCGLKRLWD